MKCNSRMLRWINMRERWRFGRTKGNPIICFDDCFNKSILGFGSLNFFGVRRTDSVTKGIT
jgi:hypothetical protein